MITSVTPNIELVDVINQIAIDISQFVNLQWVGDRLDPVKRTYLETLPLRCLFMR